MTSRRELRLAVALCLLGSALVLLGVTRPWGTVTEDSLTIRGVSVPLPGTLAASNVRALGLVGLAAVVAIAATRSWGRQLVGALTALAGAAVVVLVARLLHGDLGARLLPPHSSSQPRPRLHLLWPWLTLVGGIVLLSAGAVVLARGRRWSALGSSYEVPTSEPVHQPATDKGTWDALDRGDDPTA